MSLLSLECNICLNLYDADRQTPMVLHCDHTLCLFCFNNLSHKGKKKTCPDCRKPSPPVISKNFALLRLIEELMEKDKKMYGKCAIHNKPTILMCLTCKARICQVCAETNSHFKHNTEHVDDYLERIKKEEDSSRRIHEEVDLDIEYISGTKKVKTEQLSRPCQPLIVPQVVPRTVEIRHYAEYNNFFNELYICSSQTMKSQKILKLNLVNLEQLHQTEHLTIVLEEDFGDDEINTFCQLVLEKIALSALKHLYLSFKKTRVTEKTFERLFEKIKACNALEGLYLCLEGTEKGLGDKVAELMSSYLMGSCTKLSCFDIHSDHNLDRKTRLMIQELHKNHPKLEVENATDRCVADLIKSY